MKKPLLLTIAATIILLILGVWVYLMLFGTPDDTGEVFTNLGFQSNNQPVVQQQVTIPGSDSPSIDRLVDTTSASLNQLTTRPVAGYTTYIASSTDFVRYVERGTGHVYDINIASGEEFSISPTTIPYVAEAVFSSNPDTVAMTSHQGYVVTTRVGSVATGQFISQTINGTTDNERFLDDTTFAYSTLDGGTTVGNFFTTNTGTIEEQFRFAYAELDVWWGTDSNPTYIATKPAAGLASFVYELTPNGVRSELSDVVGLTGFTNHEQHIISYRTNGGYTAATMNVADGSFAELPVITLREKCVFDGVNDAYLWCAAPFTVDNPNYLDDWYKGTIVNEDYLWLVNTETQTAELVLNPERASGRTVDMVNVGMNQTATTIYFINKTDRTLWRYDLLAD